MDAKKCPNCGNTLRFNPNFAALYCDYCNTQIEIKGEEILFNKRNYVENFDFKKTTTTQFHCNSCGSNLSSIKDATIRRCPNCASLDLEMTNNISLEPDGIVPFKISKEKATENFYNWIKKRKWAPHDLKKLAKMGKISGLYSPIWTFDCKSNSIYSGIGVDEEKDSYGEVTYKKTPFRGSNNYDYYDYPISANRNIPDSKLRELGNFGLNNLKVYNPLYLCGFIGSDIDKPLNDCYDLFKMHVEETNRYNIKKMYNDFDRIENFDCKTKIYNSQFNYVYVPIWTNCYTYKKKTYHSYINGYNGIVKGTAPKSFWKFFFVGLSIATIATVAILLIKNFF